MAIIEVDQIDNIMLIMCKDKEAFKAIDDLVDHLTKSHVKHPCNKEWAVFGAVALMNPNKLQDSAKEIDTAILDVEINCHNGGLLLTSFFGKITIWPSKPVFQQGQVTPLTIEPKHK